MTEEENKRAKMWFYRRTQFPGVIMCVDGTHIKILPPADEPYLYYIRKGYYSLNAMVICDNKMQIRCVDARFPGSSHDSHVWNVSTAKTYFEERYRQGDKTTWILCDAEYPLQPWLITPFCCPVAGSRESAFNKTHSKARNIVKRVIGILKNRFRCLLSARQLHYSPQKVVQIINVVCALHNMCIHYNVEDNTPDIMDDEYQDVNEEEAPSEFSREASDIRMRILRSLPN
ncbi:putative nuclease HARBI1 [Rhagoletis pomonella]|uniref:putative nuclease HARBI1 n=1 Tax=Rhagoletis pomonella TaxID=28610 RepID=UPI00177F7EC6|nr:putative nuclease HARBI1 [Rhagoletis pomonella]